MATATVKRAAKKRPLHKSKRRLSNAELLRLAQTHRPPQSWYDDTTDPTKPAKR